MKEIKRVLAAFGVLALALLIAAVFFSAVDAQLSLGFRATSVATWGFDSSFYPPDSVIAYHAGNTFSGVADSMRRLTTNICKPQGYGKPDTLCRYTIIIPADIGQSTHNPSMYFAWYLSNAAGDEQVLRDNAPQITYLMRKVDSLVEPIGGAGTGANTITLVAYDSVTAHTQTIQGAVISVYQPDTSALVAGTGPRSTDVAGIQTFNLDNATYPVNIKAAGFFTETAYQLLVVTANSTDTIWMWHVTPAAPPASGLTSVIFTFEDGLGNGIKNVQIEYWLDGADNQDVFHVDGTRLFDAGTKTLTETDANGQVTISVVPNDSILVTGDDKDQTFWRFTAKSPISGADIFDPDGKPLRVPASATALSYPLQRTLFGE